MVRFITSLKQALRKTNLSRMDSKCLHSDRASQMKVEMITSEIIKPSSPTPNHFRILKLSLLEQLGPTIFVPFVFFYSFNRNHTDNRHFISTKQSQKLRKSLSETLTHYYPLAGRLKDNIYIDCDDSGAEYREARVNSPLSNFLDEPYIEGLQQLIPAQVDSQEARTKLLLVQANFFSCGGMAIGVCASHKLADASSLGIFMKGWAAMSALGSITDMGSPVFNASSVFPPETFSCEAPAPVVEPAITKRNLSKRFVFEAFSIKALQAKSASSEVKQPTRVEAVSALIWKCCMKATRTASGTSRPSILTHAVNLRKGLSPPFQENSLGNLVSFFAAQADENNQTKVETLISEIRKGKQKFCDEHIKKLVGNEKASEIICNYQREAGDMIASGDFDFYIVSSICRLGLYETDFGWGEPRWVSISCVQQKNIIVLMDTKEAEGIEAWVTLNEEEMKIFEQDRELLDFASLNPALVEPSRHLF